jgi:hypothetical protein
MFRKNRDTKPDPIFDQIDEYKPQKFINMREFQLPEKFFDKVLEIER